MDIPFVSVYAFSTENWKRADDEVKGLMSILRIMLKKELNEIMKSERKLVFLGDRTRMPKDLQRLMMEAEEKTKNFKKGTLGICMSYGGQDEIAQAAQAAVNAGETTITSDVLEKYLYAPELPPVDLIIRTSGEQRISNFMLWRSAYSELAFTKTYWPAFTVEELQNIIDDYMGRSRRFGK
jgi:undecaprenyl diphosphate synthase